MDNHLDEHNMNYKKDSKEPSLMGKWFGILMISVFIIAGIGFLMDDEAESEPPAASDVESSTFMDDPDHLGGIIYIESLLAGAYEGTAETGFHEANHFFYILPTSTPFINETRMMLEGQISHQHWLEFTDEIKDFSLFISDQLGHNDYSFALLNPDSPDLILYSARGGMTLYDVFD